MTKRKKKTQEAATKLEAPPPEKAASVEVALPPVLANTVEVSVPLAVLDDGYAARHVDVQFKTARQKRTMRRIVRALQDQHAQMLDGRHVDSAASAMRWLIEQIGLVAEAKV